MQRIRMHRPGWVHPRRSDWHTMGVHFDHLIHDPRFWAAIALAVLLGLMILVTVITQSTGTTTRPVYPTYPYMP